MLSVILVVSTVKPKDPDGKLSTVQESAQGKNPTPQLNCDWECVYQKHCRFIFHVTSHMLFSVKNRGKVLPESSLKKRCART